ncbi:MAG: type IV pilin N-terminal domain-containing protein [Methanocorpusculum sp.]|nr:type IV pilin N-terminal domain-containing protein [Methanocorpusculum sp.]
MKKDSKKDSAVSPVIGTILLVAITVVLVAIISAVVMGMTGNVGQTYTVGVKVTNDGSNTIVTITGGDLKQMTEAYIINASTNKKLTSIEVGIPNTVDPALTGETTVVGKFSTGNQTIWSGNLQ